MANREKTPLFWAGLIILSLASVVLFTVIWTLRGYSSTNLNLFIQQYIPLFVGAIVFILIGLFMMKSGIRSPQPQATTQLSEHKLHHKNKGSAILGH
jgi:putative Mn2+ efflux pump MntP